MTDVDLVAAVDAVVRPATAEDRAHAHRRLLDAGGEAVPALLRALAEGLAAEPIIETLGLLGDLRAVSPLRRMLRRSDADVACAAAKALGHIPHGAAVWALRDGLASPHQRVRIEALLSLAHHAASEETLLATQAEVTLLALAADDVAPLVEAILWRLAPRARDIAFAAALRTNPGIAVETALRHMRRQRTAQSAREVLRQPEALHPLIFLLNSETAADILPMLADIGLQLQAAGRGSPHDALADIVGILTNWYDPEEPELAAVVVEALQTVGDGALDLLQQRLIDADAEERPYILSLLHALGWDPAQDVEGLHHLLAIGAWERIAALGPAAIEPLIAELQSPDLERREAAAETLTRLGYDPDDRVVRYLLAAALGRWEALPRRDGAARAVLLTALAEEREAAGRLQPGAVDDRAPRRLAMIRALARFPAVEAIHGLVITLRDDPSAPVREAASRALEERGRDAIPIIAQVLAREEGLGEHGAAFRCDLIHLLARQASHARPTTTILRRLAEEDVSQLVRDAAAAALDRVTAQDQRRAHYRGPSSSGGRSPAGPPLGPRAAADVGQALRSAGQDAPETLVQQLEADDPAQVGRAVAALVAMGRAGTPIRAPLEQLLLTGSLRARKAAAQALDRLQLFPERPEPLAAYHLAHGDLASCEALGAPARAVLREALPLLDWRSAGAVALSLLRLGEPLSSPALVAVVDLLVRVASVPDTHVSEALRGGERRAARAHGVSLAVSRSADRRAARALLAALQDEAQRVAAAL